MTTKLLSRNNTKKSLILFTLFIFSSSVFSQSEFITTWKTDNPGTSNDMSITIPTTGGGYNYEVDWTYDGITFNAESTSVMGNITHDYGVAGTYTVAIRGTFPRIYFNCGGDKEKIISIEQWGTNPWTSMQAAFYCCLNLVSNATDAPNLSGVTDASDMFWNAISFNADLSSWDVSSITDMSYMLGITAVTGDLSGWDVSNVTNMYAMFSSTTAFNGNISNWDVSKVTDMGAMFDYAEAFNGDLSSWNVSNVTDMSYMFSETLAFNGDLNNWDVSKVTDMDNMFAYSQAFNGDLSNWNFDLTDDLNNMFYQAIAFNRDLSTWDVSGIVDMDSMFSGATAFNQDIGNWDVSGVTDMSSMFRGATSFNGDLSNWNVSGVTSMSAMFNEATSFNGDLSNWNVSGVRDMAAMFREATLFNGDISGWNVSSVIAMPHMFSGATSFDQDLGAWDISSMNDMQDMFLDATLSTTNYDNTLIGWNTLSAGETIPTNIFGFSGGNSTYCNGEAARLSLETNYSWFGITDGGLDCSGLGINDNDFSSSINLYPNPSHEEFSIKGLSENSVLEIYNLNGQLVLKRDSYRGHRVDITRLSSSVYFVEVSNSLGTAIKRLIKE